jgi:hypothetical protein
MKASRLPVLGRLRLLAIVVMVTGLMTPSFPTSGPGESKPSATPELAWNPVETSFDPLLEGDEIPAEPIEDEPTEAPEPDEDSINLNESIVSLYVSGARRSVLRPAFRATPAQPRDPSSKAFAHSRSGRGDRALALDLPTRLCRLTC